MLICALRINTEPLIPKGGAFILDELCYEGSL